MKRLSLTVLLLLLATSCFAGFGMQVVASAPAGCAGCATDTVDQEQTDTTWGSGMTTGVAKGQSFQVSKTGKISAIAFYMNHQGTDHDIEIRWGTSNNLGTYIANGTARVTADGWYKITFATKEDVSTGTTYYCGVAQTSSGGTQLEVRGDNSSPTYASGSYYYGSSGWNMTDPLEDRDLAFRVYLCD